MKPSPLLEEIRWIEDQLGSQPDVVAQEIRTGDIEARLVYVCSLCNEKLLNEQVLRPLFAIGKQSEFESYLLSLPRSIPYPGKEKSVHELMYGYALLLAGSCVVLLDMREKKNSAVTEADVEKVIQGPQFKLSEDLETSLNLLRHRYHQPSLFMEKRRIGTASLTEIALLYDKKRIDPHTLELIKQELDQVQTDVLFAAGQLEKLMAKRKRKLFPTMMTTDRPDRVALNLAQGKAVILIEGTPFALVAPTVFYDFMSTMDDLYQSVWISGFLIFLRYLGLLICLLVPALYVAVTAYSPELFRVQLAFSVAGSRVGVPFPAFLEVLFMLIMMELLTEASVRLPNVIGSTATTVGGLILGQAVTQAGLVSDIMIIIVAAVAISNFVIPINAMSFAVRIAKYFLLACCIGYGIVGLVVGSIALVAYIVRQESFGQPYFKLFFVPTAKEAQRLQGGRSG
ncbi:spore germination protein [Paenibacillus sp. IB182496]|uniref:Spore germination protein n=1 Tax=Paenibacillus sabuli TaxID=2772509 RepID=A0A927BVH3_9BACL|nr:spore germination protein [Paenibacillus sabuli]MBD2847102.1 spore germination protein [Paenibacillus sabuli]